MDPVRALMRFAPSQIILVRLAVRSMADRHELRTFVGNDNSQ